MPTKAFSRRLLFAASLCLFALTLLCTPTGRLSVGARKKTADGCSLECLKQLAAARAATAKYHLESRALADGYVPVSPCVAVPGLGAMGIHYANFSLMDGRVDPARPELLLYLPDQNGRRQLVGVEYFVPAAAVTTAPTLFGKTFDGPMPGHGPGEPVHYDLHVWLWSHNPAGMFAQFNPKLTCPPA
jgi:hypothetical protein